MKESSFYYHGTTISNGKNIISSSNVRISENIGTLGKGFYAFDSSEKSAFKYSKRLQAKRYKNQKMCIIKFRLKKERIKNIVDLTDVPTMEYFEEYIQANLDEIYELKKQYNNDDYAKRLDGVIIESFIASLENNHITNYKIKGVYNSTVNKLGKFMIPGSVISNSIELCIRDNDLIDYETLEICNEIEGR